MNKIIYKVSYWLSGTFAIVSIILFILGYESVYKYDATVYYIFCIGIFNVAINFLLFGIKNHIEYIKEFKS